MIEDFFVDGKRHYVVTEVFGGLDEAPFERGVEVLRWNGIPIERAVEINGNRFAGSNLEARRARGVETMTIRSLIQSLPPDEDRVVLDYRTKDGKTHELRVGWMVFSPDDRSSEDARVSDEVAASQGVDLELAICRRVRKLLFAPKVVAAEAKLARGGESATQNLGLQSSMPGVLQARPVDTPFGRFGYLRIRTFDVPNANEFVDEVIRLLRQLPQNGLVIDVRGNGGGLITAGEQLLQLFSPNRIEPEPVQFINSALNMRLCDRLPFLSQWTPSIRESLRTGAIYSRGFPITSSEDANNVGQQYYGPVVLITDALCYSTTDIFAAGFQDQVENGLILGVDGNTGAGGANVWTHDLLRRFLPSGVEDSPYQPLPNGSGLRVSIRRTMRVGKNAGTPVEDLGVVPDMRHDLTRDDVLNGNVDLVNRAGEILSEMPVRVLDVDVEMDDESLVVNLDTRGFDRLDVFADSRPLGSIDVEDGSTELPLTISADSLEFRGLMGQELVAIRRVDV